jgi:hypothetical protein
MVSLGTAKATSLAMGYGSLGMMDGKVRECDEAPEQKNKRRKSKTRRRDESGKKRLGASGSSVRSEVSNPRTATASKVLGRWGYRGSRTLHDVFLAKLKISYIRPPFSF